MSIWSAPAPAKSCWCRRSKRSCWRSIRPGASSGSKIRPNGWMTKIRLRFPDPRLHLVAALHYRPHVPHVDVLPAVPDQATSDLPPSQVRDGMRMSIGDGVFAQVFLTITTGSFVTALALFMGASNFALGLIGA